jgi:hypothetical protein
MSGTDHPDPEAAENRSDRNSNQTFLCQGLHFRSSRIGLRSFYLAQVLFLNVIVKAAWSRLLGTITVGSVVTVAADEQQLVSEDANYKND